MSSLIIPAKYWKFKVGDYIIPSTDKNQLLKQAKKEVENGSLRIKVVGCMERTGYYSLATTSSISSTTLNSAMNRIYVEKNFKFVKDLIEQLGEDDDD